MCGLRMAFRLYIKLVSSFNLLRLSESIHEYTNASTSTALDHANVP